MLCSLPFSLISQSFNSIKSLYVSANLPKEATALDYAKALITAYNTNGNTPNGVALNALKEEARRLL